MQLLQYDLPSSAAKDNSITHAATAPCNIHAPIPMRSATKDSKTPYNHAHRNTPKAASSHRYTAAKKKNVKPTAAAPAAQTRYLSSPPAATLHGKTQGFVLRLPPHNIAQATFMQPLQCDSLRHHYPSSPLPSPSSPLPFVTTSLRHHPCVIASNSFVMY